MGDMARLNKCRVLLGVPSVIVTPSKPEGGCSDLKDPGVEPLVELGDVPRAQGVTSGWEG